MPRTLIDLLWRAHPAAPTRGRRGPQARRSTNDVLRVALGLADTEGLGAITARSLASALGVSTMSIYTYVNSRDDLLVLMADQAHAEMERAPWGRLGWRQRVRLLAEQNLALHQQRPWLLDIDDERTALGPGTIAKYDHELAALTPLDLDDVTRDAALSFVLDFARAGARARRPGPRAGELAESWPEWSARLQTYLGDEFPLAQRVGAAAGAEIGGAYSATRAWEFGLQRVIAALADL